ncbi:DNA-binding PadR family transcriptional regulator [Paenibacillus shirakamiensis]|uniref:DNA-binding PadR family transcriptional regulator n=1 Tax=Paenibacillus shirakamiensis TaxID=1265935 RepID=A0ABS4JFL8_9BACL|nr:PadR family transcriptional regulator [Paenibacillus shirakamiensis]MBP2000511.1 DNA-binding PadR family transcriptional regulator [Paenibacillus shirakamiensis]
MDFVILGMLLERPMSGYELKKTVDVTIGLFYKASYGSLYPALKRLENRGWIGVNESDNQKNKKTAYIQPEGKAAFLDWLQIPTQLSRKEQMLRFFFFDYLDQPTRQKRLTERADTLRKEIKQLERVEADLADKFHNREQATNHNYRIHVLHYGLQYLTVELNWIQQIREDEP